MREHVGAQRPMWEVADVIRSYGDSFLARHSTTAEQRRVLRDLSDCRTAVLGGHVQHCLDCGQERIAYNSCRNRHCPKCQALSRARWLERESKLLLPVEYHHVVFTLPAELSDVALANPKLMYTMLMQAASATLRDVSANPKWLGAMVGVLMVLHTWGQNLHHHPHVHCVVTGGGLSCNERGEIDASPEWRSCRPGFFLPVRVLSRVFRGKYLELLKVAFDQGKLTWVGRQAHLSDATTFAAWLRSLYAKEWVVYAKPPFGGPAQVLKYLARYTHRVAISNSRILDVREGRVTFRYKDYAEANRDKVMSLSAEEFLRRFVQHVLPRGFTKIRHYGILSNRHRKERLKTCRALLEAKVYQRAVDVLATPTEEAIAKTAEPTCPRCGGCRIIRRELMEKEAEEKSKASAANPPDRVASGNTS